MSEKLCLQWNDFQDNVKSAFGNLRECTDFNDVTLACEDGRQIEAHKVVLAASSPFFQTVLKKNKHSHPLIYMRGVKSVDLMAIVDFLYFGEANVFQEDLDSFLALAEELELKGLKDSNAENDWKETNPLSQIKPTSKKQTPQMTENAKVKKPNKNVATMDNKENSLAIPSRVQFSGDFDHLDEMVNSMMETSQERGKSCKVCGREGQSIDIKRHIEANHLKGVSIPCNQCDKTFRSRDSLRKHVSNHHKQ